MSTMPVTVPVFYAAFREQLADGNLDVSTTRCPRHCDHPGSLVLTSKRRTRCFGHVVEVVHGTVHVTELVFEEIVVPLVECPGCGFLCRVLPADALARKTVGLTVIEHFTALYFRGTCSLRQAVLNLHGERTPSHTALHGWTEGFGAYALGQPSGAVAHSTPAHAVTARVAERRPLGRMPVPPAMLLAYRARSAARRERLVAGFAFLAIAFHAAAACPVAAGCLAALSALIIGYGLRDPLGWRTGLC
jgi:hypothetical protein